MLDYALAVRFPVLGDDTSVTVPLAGYSICSLSNLQVLLALSFRLVVMSRTAHSKDPALLLDAVAVESIMPCVDRAAGSTRRLVGVGILIKFAPMKKILTVLLAAFAIMSCGNNPKQAQSLKGKPWQEIAPTEIELNPVQMIDKDWMEVSAGKEGNMNLMTISWGTIGELWGKPVFTVFVSTSRYTHKFMEENDYFTVTHFPADMRQQLSYLGRVSGRDEDKVAGAGLTVEFTELGNPIYAEADLAIECKKLYGQQFDANLMPAEQREWYEKSGLGIHYMYIGEIIHVWKK